MVLNRLSQLVVRKPLLAQSIASRIGYRYSSTKGKKGGFDPMHLVNYLGLPVIGVIFFYVLPVAHTDEMKNAEWNGDYYRNLQKKIREEREAANK